MSTGQSESPSHKLRQVVNGSVGELYTEATPGWRLYAQGTEDAVRCLRLNKSGAYCWGPRPFSSQWLRNRLATDGVRIRVGPVDDVVPVRMREHFRGGHR